MGVRTITLNVQNLPESINLYRVTEGKATTLEIDCTEWAKMGGTMSVYINFRRPFENTFYTVSGTLTNGIYKYDLTSTDTGISGEGEMQITASNGTVSAVSSKIRTIIEERISGTESSTPPTPVASWYTNAINAAATATSAAQTVSGAVTDINTLKSDVTTLKNDVSSQKGTNATLLRAISNKADEDDFEELQGTVNDAVEDIDDLKEKQSSLKANIDTKASKKALANTDRKLQAMYDLQNGQTWAMMTDEDADNPKSVVDGSALATVTEWGGKTVAWNQIAKVTNRDGSSFLGITFRTENEQSFWFEGTTTGRGMFSINSNIRDELTMNHVYLAYIENANSIHLFKKDIDDCVACEKYEDTYFYNFGIIFAKDTTYTSYVVYKPHLMDLTKIFGITETSQVTDAMKNWVTSYAATHPAYNEGELVSADVSSIVSTGRNLINPSQFGSYARVQGDKIYSDKEGYYYDFYDNSIGNGHVKQEKYPSIEAGTYTVSCKEKSGNFIIYKCINGELTLLTAIGITPVNVTFDTDCKYTFRRSSQTSEGFIKGLILQKGTTAKAYAPYMYEAHTLPTAVRTQYPLRSAGTVHDEIVYDGKKWTHTKRVEKVSFNSVSGWTLMKQGDDGMKTYRNTLENIGGGVSSGEGIVCESEAHFISDVANMYEYGSSVTGILNNTSSGNSGLYIYYNINGEMSNTVTVFYTLKTPVTTDITDLMQDWDGTLPTETGGTITFVCNDETLWQVPNTVEYAVRLSDVVGG